MHPDEKVLQALADKATEQSAALTLWLQKEFGLPPEYQVKAKFTLSIKRVKGPPKTMANQQNWVFDQQPTSDDWLRITDEIERLLARAKAWQRSRLVWNRMLVDLRELRHEFFNVGYVQNASKLNLYLQKHNFPYRLIRVDKPGEETQYSLRAARVSTETR